MPSFNKQRDEIVTNITDLTSQLKPLPAIAKVNTEIERQSVSYQFLLFAIIVEVVITLLCGLLGAIIKSFTVELKDDELSLLKDNRKINESVHQPKVRAKEEIYFNDTLKSKPNIDFSKGEQTGNFDISKNSIKRNTRGEQGELGGELIVTDYIERNNEFFKNCGELTGEQGELQGELEKNQGELEGEQESELTAQVNNIRGEQTGNIGNITGNIIRNLRNHLGCTQKSFASLIGISKRYLIKIEGDKANVSKDIIDKIFTKFKLSSN